MSIIRRYSKAEYDEVMRLRAQRLRHTEIERRSSVPIKTFQAWFYKGCKTWSARTAEENHRSYSREKSDEEIEKARISKLGMKNPMWKGDEATEESIRQRLHRSMPVPKGYERHHIDGNVKNSDPGNILILTRREHMIEDGRMEALIKRNKSLEYRKTKSESMMGKKHYRWQGDKASANAKRVREYRARKRKKQEKDDIRRK